MEKDAILLDVLAFASQNIRLKQCPVLFVFLWETEKCADILTSGFIALLIWNKSYFSVEIKIAIRNADNWWGQL